MKHAVMLFETERNLGISDNPTKWVYKRTLKFGDDGGLALLAYVSIRNPASQMISAETEEELTKMEQDMIENFKSQEWLNENLYPYL
jgi:hypothetical protein